MCTCNKCKSCGHRRAHKRLHEQYVQRWLKGEETGYIVNNYRLSGHVRNFLLEEAGHKCTSCGWNKMNETSQSIPLHIDHIDGNAKNCSRKNLRVLCPNCHSLTPTYGALNIGHSVRK